MLYKNLVSNSSLHNVEQFVRYPETLAPETQCAIEKHLVCDALAHSTADFYRGFYRELDALDDVASSKLEAFVDALFSASSCPHQGA